MSRLVAPIYIHYLGSSIQEAMITGYIKKCMLGLVGRGSGWLTCCEYGMYLLSMYDHKPWYGTRPKISATAVIQ